MASESVAPSRRSHFQDSEIDATILAPDLRNSIPHVRQTIARVKRKVE